MWVVSFDVILKKSSKDIVIVEQCKSIKSRIIERSLRGMA